MRKFLLSTWFIFDSAAFLMVSAAQSLTAHNHERFRRYPEREA